MSGEWRMKFSCGTVAVAVQHFDEERRMGRVVRVKGSLSLKWREVGPRPRGGAVWAVVVA